MRYKKIIFLVSSLSQPRAIRRVESIAEMGVDTLVYGYDRQRYDCNKFSDKIKVNTLGVLANGEGYINKVKKIRNDIRSIISLHERENNLYYSFGFIETFFLWVYQKPYIYEISDITYSSSKLKIWRFLLRKVDQLLIKNSKLTVMTSEGFKTYLRPYPANIIIQPNKINRKLIACKRVVLNKQDSKYIFGFVGSIRNENVLRFAKVIGESFPQHEFHFYGVANVNNTQEKLDTLVSTYKNVKVYGEFRNPEDLGKIYNSIDMIVCTYGSADINSKILEPNKLYESIFFCRPIIVSANTFLAQQVRKYNCGFVIDSSTEWNISDFICHLTIEETNHVSEVERRITDEFPFDNTKELESKLKQIIQMKVKY